MPCRTFISLESIKNVLSSNLINVGVSFNSTAEVKKSTNVKIQDDATTFLALRLCSVYKWSTYVKTIVAVSCI